MEASGRNENSRSSGEDRRQEARPQQGDQSVHKSQVRGGGLFEELKISSEQPESIEEAPSLRGQRGHGGDCFGPSKKQGAVGRTQSREGQTQVGRPINISAFRHTQQELKEFSS